MSSIELAFELGEELRGLYPDPPPSPVSEEQYYR